MKQQNLKLIIPIKILILCILTNTIDSVSITSPVNNTVDPLISSTALLKQPAKSAESNEPSKQEIPGPEPRKIKSTSKDSYLDALDHSHLSHDPHEGVVRVDMKSKSPKIIRSTYEGPVYRPSTEYGPPKQSYGSPNNLGGTVKSPRIAYGGPITSEPFLPTPSNSYMLPLEHSGSYNHQNPYGNGPSLHGMSQVSYGLPSTSYGPASSPQNVYGPPLNGYLPVGQVQGEARGSVFSL